MKGGFKSKNECPPKERDLDTETHREENHVMTEAEIEEAPLQRKECWRVLRLLAAAVKEHVNKLRLRQAKSLVQAVLVNDSQSHSCATGLLVPELTALTLCSC